MKGLTYLEISEKMGISRQRVQQLVRPVAPVYSFVRKRANSKCEKCGIEIRSGNVHHKRETGLSESEFNSIDNLEYLCVGCHMAIPAKDRGKRKRKKSNPPLPKEVRKAMSVLGKFLASGRGKDIQNA